MTTCLKYAGVLAAWLLGACAGVPPTTISVSDGGVTMPTFRIGWTFPSSTQEPSAPQTGQGLELGATGGRGSDTQTLVAGQQPVQFGGSTFFAPQTLGVEFDFAFYDISYRLRYFPDGDSLGIEVLAGAAYTQLDVTVSSPTQRATDSLSAAGLTATFGLIWRALSSTSVHARIGGFWSGHSSNVNEADRIELYVAQALARNVVLRAGYARWRAETDRTDASNVEIEFSGPTLGLELQF